jgi:hypothetical protein
VFAIHDTLGGAIVAVVISMIAFSEQPNLSAADIQSDFAAKWKDLPISVETAANADESDNTLAFQVGSAQVLLGIMPVPIPWSSLEGPCATSILWPKAAEHLKPHKAHVVVTVVAESNPIQLYTLLTQVTASVMAASSGALGVYWGAATLVIPKNIFLDFAVEVLPKGPPLYIWVDFRVGRENDNSSGGFTTGMTALGHMELEAQNAPEKPAQLQERMLALAGYVLEKGPVIRDGDTVGENANERIRVVYANSAFGHKGKVMRLEYGRPSAKKPWWKLV